MRFLVASIIPDGLLICVMVFLVLMLAQFGLDLPLLCLLQSWKRLRRHVEKIQKTLMGVPSSVAAVKEDGSIFACLSLCLCLFICSRSAVSQLVWPNFHCGDDCCFWSGAGPFVLNLLDDGLRTNLGTSARELLSFSEIANMPDFSVRSLQASTESCEESTLNCLVLHSSVVLTASRRFALQWLCVAPRLVFTGWFSALAVLLCSLGRFPVFPFFSPLVTVSVHHSTWCCSSGNAVCHAFWILLVSGM